MERALANVYVCCNQALEEASAISEGGVTDTLKNFLQLNMPKARLV